MRKLKEFLFFPLALILLIAIFVGVFLLLVPDNAYYSGGEYLKLMVKDEYFMSAMFITFSIPLLISSVVTVISAAIMAVLHFRKKAKITRNNFYMITGFLSAGFSIAYFALFTNAMQITDEMNLSVQMTVFAVIFSVMIAVVTSFLFFFAELVSRAIIKYVRKKKKA